MDILEGEKLNTSEVAKLLSVGPSTLAGWRLKGIGPRFVRFGGAVRYLRADVERWAAEQNGG